MGKILGPFVLAFGAIVAIGAGMEVTNQAGIFWGLVVTVVVMLFVLLAMVGLISRPTKS